MDQVVALTLIYAREYGQSEWSGEGWNVVVVEGSKEALVTDMATGEVHALEFAEDVNIAASTDNLLIFEFANGLEGECFLVVDADYTSAPAEEYPDTLDEYQD